MLLNIVEMLLLGLMTASVTVNSQDFNELVCPPPQEGKVGDCANSCGSGCPGQLCCSNGCGKSCMDGIKKPSPRTPIYGCPPVNVKGPCDVTKCGMRDGLTKCPGSQLCCHNGCTYTCMDGVPIDRPALCSLPAKVGKCKAKIEKYYFDATMNACRLFYYGGCGANENNFETMEECEKQCLGSVPIDVCKLAKEKGKRKCREREKRYFYHAESMTCEEFCGEGLNNFKDKEICEKTCDPCSQPKMIGPCKGAFHRYFYNSETEQCEKFLYGGCKGNMNNFYTQQQCKMKCKPTCEFYCRSCGKQKKYLAKCSGCQQRKVEDYKQCAACVKSGTDKYTKANYLCFNCKK